MSTEETITNKTTVTENIDVTKLEKLELEITENKPVLERVSEPVYHRKYGPKTSAMEVRQIRKFFLERRRDVNDNEENFFIERSNYFDKA